MNIELHAGNVGSKQKGQQQILLVATETQGYKTQGFNERFQDAVDFQTHPAKQAADLFMVEG